MLEFFAQAGNKVSIGRAVIGTGFGFEMPAGALDGKFLIVQQMFDGQNQFHIAAPVDSLARIGPSRFDARKFVFPEAQYRCRYTGNAAHFTDSKKKFIRYMGRI